jgi:hypothetical protein
MKIRQVAGFALVGWYLMTPPLLTGAHPPDVLFDLHAPTSKWSRLRTYSTATDCQKEIETMNNLREEWARRHDTEPVRTNARCVASDDLRLKEK